MPISFFLPGEYYRVRIPVTRLKPANLLFAIAGICCMSGLKSTDSYNDLIQVFQHLNTFGRISKNRLP